MTTRLRNTTGVVCDSYTQRDDPRVSDQCHRNEIHIGGVAHCIPSNSVHCNEGNIL